MIITVSNHKGGVGKTALAAHLAFRAAEQLRVLAIDLDAQGNLSSTLLDRNARRTAAAEHLFGEEQPEPLRTNHAHIDILPASRGLTGLDRLKQAAALQAIAHLKALDRCYHLIVIDTAPALGLRLTAALASADQVLVPLVPESYAVDGVGTILSEIAAIAEHLNPAMRPTQFVLNQMNPQARQHRRIAEQVAGIVSVASPWLHRSVAVADALTEGRPVWRNPSSRKAAAQWRALCESVLAQSGALPAP